MPYATAQDLIDRFGVAELTQLTDIGEPRLKAVDSVVLATALVDASAMIDGYLVGRYALPLATPPETLRVHCAGIARYQLMRRSPDDRAKADFEAAFAFLGKVAEGKILLMAPDAAPAAPGIGLVSFNQGAKVFGRQGY